MSATLSTAPVASRRLPVRGARGRRAPRRQTGIAPIYGLLPILALLILWQLLGTEESLTVPPPSLWIDAIGALWRDGGMPEAILITLRTFLFGLVLAIIVGVALGALVGASRRADRALSPLMDFFRALPPPVVVPVAALLVGPTLSSAIAIVVIASVWPIMLNTAAGMRAVPSVRREMARSLNLSKAARLRTVILPSLTPQILLGVRISVSVALIVTLFLEVLGVTQGLGFLLNESKSQYDSAAVWGLVFLVGIAGYLVNVLVSVLEAWALRNWPGGR